MDPFSLLSLTPVLAPLLGAASGIRFVQESQRGVKLRWGRAIRDRKGNPKIVQPGFVLTLPTIHSLKRIHVRTETLVLDPQRVMLADHTVFNVGALVITKIIDTPDGVYRSLFEVDDVATSVEHYCASVLRDVLLSIAYTDLADPDKLAGQVQNRVEQRLAEWGVQVEDVKLTDCSPTPETARIILIRAEAKFKATALQDAIEELEKAGIDVAPTLAAALIGTPVAVALGDVSDTNGAAMSSRPARRSTSLHLSIGGRTHTESIEE